MEHSPAKSQESTEKTQQEAGDPTQQEEAGEPTQQEEAGDQTQQEEAGEPTQQQEAGDQTQQEEAGDPAQQQEAGDQTQQEEAGDQTQQEEAGDPAQQQEAGDQTQQEEAGDQTQQEEAGEPTQQEEAGEPTQQEEAGDQTQQEEAGEPTQQEEAGTQELRDAEIGRERFKASTAPSVGPKASIERRIPFQDILFDVESACEIRIELEAKAEVRFKGGYLPSRDDAMPGRETSTETTTDREAFRLQMPIRPPVEEEMCVMEPVSAMIAQQCAQEPMDEAVITPCEGVAESAVDMDPAAWVNFQMEAHEDDVDNIDPTPVGSAPPTRAQIEFERRTPIHGAPPQLYHSERIEPTAMIDVESMTRRDDTEETHDRSTPLECRQTAGGPLIRCENADVVEGGGEWPQQLFEEPDAGPSPSHGGCWPFNWRRHTPEADRRHELSHLVRAPEEERMLQEGGLPCPEEGDISRTERPRDVAVAMVELACNDRVCGGDGVGN